MHPFFEVYLFFHNPVSYIDHEIKGILSYLTELLKVCGSGGQIWAKKRLPVGIGSIALYMRLSQKQGCQGLPVIDLCSMCHLQGLFCRHRLQVQELVIVLL